MSYWRTVIDPILSVILPEQCRACAARECDLAGGVVCADCWQNAQLFTKETPLCGKCGAVLGTALRSDSATCKACDKMVFDRAFACGVYEGAISSSALALKKQPVIAKRLKEAIRDAIARNPGVEADVIVPVPLSKKRRFERGFNQAEMVAKVVSKSLELPIDTSLLQRNIHTPLHRAGMDLRARELSVEKAFSVADAEFVRHKHILLVDDVFTSGATVNACSAVLKKNGASSVIVFTVARAVQGRC